LSQAAENYIKGLRREANNMEGLDNLGKVFFKKHDYIKAIKVWMKAVELSSENNYLWYYIGIAYEKNGNIKEAVGCWQKIKDDSVYFDKAKNRIIQHR